MQSQPPRSQFESPSPSSWGVNEIARAIAERRARPEAGWHRLLHRRCTDLETDPLAKGSRRAGEVLGGGGAALDTQARRGYARRRTETASHWSLPPRLAPLFVRRKKPYFQS